MPPIPQESSILSPLPEKTLFLLGGYTDKSVLAHCPDGKEGRGVYSLLFDPVQEKLTKLSSSSVETNPAFILKHPQLDIIYMTTEVITDSGSELLVARLDRVTGEVFILQRKPVHGRSTCHIEWDADRSHLIAVSYWDSRLTTFPVEVTTGMLGCATEVYRDPGAEYVDIARPDRWEHLAHRQRWPHLHQVNRDPYSQGKLYLIPDLGRDQIQLFSIKHGSITKLGFEQLRLGLGPRHMEFHRRLEVVYVCGELDNTVTVLTYNKKAVPSVMKGEYVGDATISTTNTITTNTSTTVPSLLQTIQTISTVPGDLSVKSTVAEMRLHPNGKFLYVANRGHNSLAVFHVDSEDGSLKRVAIQHSLGEFPRHFNFDNTGSFLIVGNHASDNVVAFRIRNDGCLDMVDIVEDLPSIVWITPCTPAPSLAV